MAVTRGRATLKWVVENGGEDRSGPEKPISVESFSIPRLRSGGSKIFIFQARPGGANETLPALDALREACRQLCPDLGGWTHSMLVEVGDDGVLYKIGRKYVPTWGKGGDMKMIGIKYCNECPHCLIFLFGRRVICTKMTSGRVVAEGIELARSEFPIPEWCPLPDYPGEGEA